MWQLRVGTKAPGAGAVVGTLALSALTAAVLWLYTEHPIFAHRGYNIMVMSAFFAFISRLVLGLWMPTYFKRSNGR